MVRDADTNSDVTEFRVLTNYRRLRTPVRAFGALEDQSRRVIPAAFEHPASASELVVGKINVSLMARVIFHYVQFARELLRPR